jgi:hypothetical protein
MLVVKPASLQKNRYPFQGSCLWNNFQLKMIRDAALGSYDKSVCQVQVSYELVGGNMPQRHLMQGYISSCV